MRHVSIVETARFGSSVSDWPPPTMPIRSVPPRFGVADAMAHALPAWPSTPDEPTTIPAAAARWSSRLRVRPDDGSRSFCGAAAVGPVPDDMVLLPCAGLDRRPPLPGHARACLAGNTARRVARTARL